MSSRLNDSRGAAPAAVTAPEAKPSAGATRVKGRESSMKVGGARPMPHDISPAADTAT